MNEDVRLIEIAICWMVGLRYCYLCQIILKIKLTQKLDCTQKFRQVNN